MTYVETRASEPNHLAHSADRALFRNRKLQCASLQPDYGRSQPLSTKNREKSKGQMNAGAARPRTVALGRGEGKEPDFDLTGSQESAHA